MVSDRKTPVERSMFIPKLKIGNKHYTYIIMRKQSIKVMVNKGNPIYNFVTPKLH